MYVQVHIILHCDSSNVRHVLKSKCWRDTKHKPECHKTWFCEFIIMVIIHIIAQKSKQNNNKQNEKIKVILSAESDLPPLNCVLWLGWQSWTISIKLNMRRWINFFKFSCLCRVYAFGFHVKIFAPRASFPF